MRKIEESQRIKEIEQGWNTSIKDLFYNWHWEDDLKHSEIGERIGVSRPTVTRWFHQFDIPTQLRTRFTNLNLLNVGPRKTPPAKPKVKKEKPVLVNTDFFKKWTPKMAYMLGYFTADGCMFVNPRGSHFIEFTSVDEEQIKRVKEMMQSLHTIGRRILKNPKWKTKYCLQIGSKAIFNNLLKLGLTPRKSKTIKLPKVPKKYFSHFVRGYFDGDGCVVFAKYFRKDRGKWAHAFHTRFTSGNKMFLKKLQEKLKQCAAVNGGSLIDKKDNFFELSFSTNDSRKLSPFFYRDVQDGCFLTRKYNKFQEALKILGT